MKTKIPLGILAFLGFGLSVYGQYDGRVGINTPTPQATLEIAKIELGKLPDGHVQGVIFPKLETSERNTFTSNAKVGTMIYNLTKKCIEWYDGTQWSCTDGTQADIPPTVVEFPSSLQIKGTDKRIASVYDADFLPFSTPTQAANWNISIPADGAPETMVIDYQGKLTTSGYEVQIPVVATSSGTLPAYSVGTWVSPAYTQNGVGRMVVLSWEAQPFTTSTRWITASVKALGGDLLVKKLDINGGLGADMSGNLMASFPLPGTAETFELRAIAAVPDRYFDKKTNTYAGGDASSSTWAANEYEHQMLYVPIKGWDGKIWLNMNLGADYAKAGGSDFDLNAAYTKTDHKAYGSLFQWQWKADGHELINWTDATTGTPKYNTPTATLSNSWTNPGSRNFITSSNTSYYSWVTKILNNADTQKDLWQSGQSNNPCPVGYHVPTSAELGALFNAIGSTYNMWNEQGLRLPASGNHSAYTAILDNQSSYGFLWSSEQYNSNSWFLLFDSSNSYAGNYDYRAVGFSVRCIKD
ncbi:FISUMP domain-containing protein [Riemerella anatipestifer]|nr:FISUMP domain-containing protein [Riemerella anatipestifer]